MKEFYYADLKVEETEELALTTDKTDDKNNLKKKAKAKVKYV